jgi:ArsR family transcriptional regulator
MYNGGVTTATLPDSARAARWFHALSDPTRLEIVRMLSHGERCVCELQGVLGAQQSRLSFHLRVLKDSGFVTDRKDGRWVHYALNREALDEIAAFATAVRPGKHAGSCRTACCP